MLTYWEPEEDGITPRKITLSKQEAIDLQKSFAKLIHNHDYENDEEALQDFISIHWAKEE